jgi:hypothetical protein
MATDPVKVALRLLTKADEAAIGVLSSLSEIPRVQAGAPIRLALCTFQATFAQRTRSSMAFPLVRVRRIRRPASGRSRFLCTETSEDFGDEIHFPLRVPKDGVCFGGRGHVCVSRLE